MYQIDSADSADLPAIDALLDAAFGAGRTAKTSYRYRQGRAAAPGLSFVARDAMGGIVATIAYWSITIGVASRPALLLGPLAVAASRRGTGIGSAMMRHALAAAAEQGHRLVALVGDPAYYQRFGFVSASRHGVVMPLEDAARVQLLGLDDEPLENLAGLILPAETTVAPVVAEFGLGRDGARSLDRWVRLVA